MFYLQFWQCFCNLRLMDDPKMYLGTTTLFPNAQTGKIQWNLGEKSVSGEPKRIGPVIKKMPTLKTQLLERLCEQFA